MKSVAQATVERTATARPEQIEARDQVMALVHEWSAGKLPLFEVRRQSTGLDRFYAAFLTPPTDPSFRDLHRMLDALIAEHQDPDEGYQYDTRFGSFSAALLHACRVKMTKLANGRLRILFPIRRTWTKRPKRDDRGNLVEDGVEGEPVYAETDKDRWMIANDLRRKPTTTTSDDKRERWNP